MGTWRWPHFRSRAPVTKLMWDQLASESEVFADSHIVQWCCTWQKCGQKQQKRLGLAHDRHYSLPGNWTVLFCARAVSLQPYPWITWSDSTSISKGISCLCSVCIAFCCCVFLSARMNRLWTLNKPLPFQFWVIGISYLVNPLRSLASSSGDKRWCCIIIVHTTAVRLTFES